MHRVDLDRRLVLRAGLAAGSLFLPAPYAWVWAQSEGTMKLLKAPKVALVLGNSKYKEAPLKNPANDANAMADAQVVFYAREVIPRTLTDHHEREQLKPKLRPKVSGHLVGNR